MGKAGRFILMLVGAIAIAYLVARTVLGTRGLVGIKRRINERSDEPIEGVTGDNASSAGSDF
jgi:hypothetical protein